MVNWNDMPPTASFSPLLRHRIVCLDRAVTPEVAGSVMAQLLLLDAESRSVPIELIINSIGGSVLDGLAIIDTMNCIQAPVHTVCIGRAASMAAWILAAGSRGRRRAAPHAEIMLHGLGGLSGEHDGPELRGGVESRSMGFRADVSDRTSRSARLERLRGRLHAMLAACTGRTSAQIDVDLQTEMLFTADEARAYGLVDEVMKGYN